MNRKKILPYLLSFSIMCSLQPFSAANVSADTSSSDVPQLLEREASNEANPWIHPTYQTEDGNTVTISNSPKKTALTKKRASSLPSAYDAREENLITPIKSQGNTGCCWAFAALKAMEANSIYNELSSLEDTDFSENHLSWYSFHSVSDPSDPLYKDYVRSTGSLPQDIYDNGGSALLASFTLANWCGAADESVAPFSANTNLEVLDMALSMQRKSDSIRYEDVVHLKDSSCFDNTSRDVIKEQLMKNGALSIAFYYSTKKLYSDEDTFSYYDSTSSIDMANHCVTLIGWDDDFDDFSPSNSPSKPGAWLVANSYGADSKYGDYIWISYEEPSLCDFYSFEAENVNDYDSIYQYDGCGWSYAYYGTEPITAANIFKNSGSQDKEIKAVGLYTIASDQDINIKIYCNVDAGDPESGTLLSECTTDKHYSYAGFHTLPLKEAAFVPSGSSFSVVATYSSEASEDEDEATVFFPIEGPSLRSNSISYGSQAGQSFLYLSEKNTWCDNTNINSEKQTIFDPVSFLEKNSTSNNNVCLKAFGTTVSRTSNEGSTIATSTPEPSPTANADREESTSLPSSSAPIVTQAPSTQNNSSISDNTQSSKTTKKISLTLKKKKIIVKKGKKKKIQYTLTPSTMKKKVRFISASRKKVTVNKKGILTGKKKGKTKVTVKVTSKIKKIITVIVR